MEIKTKFGINDVVFLIRNQTEQYREPCAACSSRGFIVLDDKKERRCPECYGNGEFARHRPTKWRVIQTLTIGKITAEAVNIRKMGDFDNYGEYEEGSTEFETKYMAYESGIGSGSVYDEENLFRTEEEAQSNCDERNKGK